MRQGARPRYADVSRKVQVIHPSGRQLREIMQWYLRTERSLARDNFGENAGQKKKKQKKKQNDAPMILRIVGFSISRINYL